ncbi:MAG TPA: HDOD domain-containing protein [Steroidobacteraceae bacterium]|jgi:HD-like signal output (HDOD) protein
MSLWLIAFFAIAAILVAIMLIRRGRRGANRISADSTTQVAALRLGDGPTTAAAAVNPGTLSSTGELEPTSAIATAENPTITQEGLNVRAETLRALREIAFNTPLVAADPPTPAIAELSAAVAATLTNIVEKPNYAPRRPMQLPKLMQAINDETSSRSALAQIIAGDPALAGNLLRLANSPYYRHSPEPIESLDRAVAMLGTEGLRSMIAAALLQPVFRVSGGSFAHFGEVTWEHSLYAANAAENYAALAESADPFAAQLLALILGLATLVVFSVAQDAFLARQRKPEATTLAALIDAHSVGVARQIAASWELSGRIDTALGEQTGAQAASRSPAGSPLGRALEFGEFIGALAVLRQRGAVDVQAADTVLRFVPAPTATVERIWARLGFRPD